MSGRRSSPRRPAAIWEGKGDGSSAPVAEDERPSSTWQGAIGFADDAPALATRSSPENNKAKEETAPRDVVLSSIAVQIIDLARSLFKEQFGREATQNDLVFPNREGNPLLETAIRQLIVELHKRQKAIDNVGWVDKDDGVRMVTQHGFRSSFYSFGMEERGFISYLQSYNDGKKVIVLDHFRDAIEHSLLHVYDPSNLKNAYARHDLLSLRQRLMDGWGDFVQKDTTKID